MPFYTITVAWTNTIQRFPKFVPEKEALVCVWVNVGTEKDLAKAHAYAERENKKRSAGEGPIRVYTFPTSEADPIGRSKQKLLRLRCECCGTRGAAGRDSKGKLACATCCPYGMLDAL